jgi:hypothetical protein
MEAKRRIDKGIDEMADRMGLVETWNDNVMTLSGSGESNGIFGTATVRNNGVDVSINVPVDLEPYAEIYRTNLVNWLIELLGPPAT